MDKVAPGCDVRTGNDDYRRGATFSTAATGFPPAKCTCSAFLAAATVLGFEVVITATPLDGEAGWRYVGDDVCGCARFVRPDRLPGITAELARLRARTLAV